MTVDFKVIGKRVKFHRKQGELTQAELAEKLGVSNVYISNIETGAKCVSLDVLLKIADEFDLSLDSLVLIEPPLRLPKAYRRLNDLLADCDREEVEQIIKLVADYKNMIRIERI